jgi:L-threonylcarbamoyladenylate synthase
MADVAEALAALQEGRPVILATDTVYGLCANPELDEAIERLQQLKGRDRMHPIALVARDVGTLLEAIPEVGERGAAIVRTLLPGPYTLVFANPRRRYARLAGDTIGVRVPVLSGAAREVVDRVGAVAATSANLHGGADPRRVEDIPAELRRAAVVLDGGELPGIASTVVDYSGVEPRVLRAGAGDVERALAAAG